MTNQGKTPHLLNHEYLRNRVSGHIASFNSDRGANVQFKSESESTHIASERIDELLDWLLIVDDKGEVVNLKNRVISNICIWAMEEELSFVDTLAKIVDLGLWNMLTNVDLDTATGRAIFNKSVDSRTKTSSRSESSSSNSNPSRTDTREQSPATRVGRPTLPGYLAPAVRESVSLRSYQIPIPKNTFELSMEVVFQNENGKIVGNEGNETFHISTDSYRYEKFHSNAKWLHRWNQLERKITHPTTTTGALLFTCASAAAGCVCAAVGAALAPVLVCLGVALGVFLPWGIGALISISVKDKYMDKTKESARKCVPYEDVAWHLMHSVIDGGYHELPLPIQPSSDN